jgi:polar amino acid transport system substrate-binding protein
MVVASADPYPPFIDPSNPKGGFPMEILQVTFKAQVYDVKRVYVSWARAEDSVKSGTYDILPVAWMTEKRKFYLAYGSEAYATNEVVFIKRKGDDFEHKGFENLKGTSLGTVVDYGYSDAFLASCQFTREPTFDLMANINKLISKHIDLTLEDSIVARAQIMKKKPILLDEIQFTKGNPSRDPLHMTVGIANPRQAEILEAFNKDWAAIKANDTYINIIESYGIK